MTLAIDRPTRDPLDQHMIWNWGYWDGLRDARNERAAEWYLNGPHPNPHYEAGYRAALGGFRLDTDQWDPYLAYQAQSRVDVTAWVIMVMGFLMLLAVVGALVYLSIRPAAASSTHCAAIRDADSRALCYAMANDNVSRCAAIRDSDKRNLCKSLVGRK